MPRRVLREGETKLYPHIGRYRDYNRIIWLIDQSTRTVGVCVCECDVTWDQTVATRSERTELRVLFPDNRRLGAHKMITHIIWLESHKRRIYNRCEHFFMRLKKTPGDLEVTTMARRNFFSNLQTSRILFSMEKKSVNKEFTIINDESVEKVCRGHRRLGAFVETFALNVPLKIYEDVKSLQSLSSSQCKSHGRVSHKSILVSVDVTLQKR